MYDNIVFRTFVKITYCDKAFLIKDYHLRDKTRKKGSNAEKGRHVVSYIR